MERESLLPLVDHLPVDHGQPGADLVQASGPSLQDERVGIQHTKVRPHPDGQTTNLTLGSRRPGGR